jgi:hypothetical protein
MKSAIHAFAVGFIFFCFVGCAQREPEQVATGCLADSLVNLRVSGNDARGCGGDVMRCRDACADGDASSCLGAANAMQAEDEAESTYAMLYYRACALGLANGCTNYAAGIWAGEPSPKELTCAHQIFEKACHAKEHFACGMRARLTFEGDSAAAKQAAKARLESDCNAIGGFPCRVLALHLEKGELGPYEPGKLKALLVEACRGNDTDACGDHESVAATFNRAD